MIDIHNHIIPGVDDGSESVEESMEMVKQYIESGYTGVICTSHYYPQKYEVNRNKVLEGIDVLRKECANKGLEFDFYPGNEIYLTMETEYYLKQARVSSLNGGRYILVELPFLAEPHYARNLIYGLQLQGYVVIFAHCERYKYVQENPDWLLEFIKSGCLIQVNANSLNGKDTSSYYRTIITLLERNMVHFIATDAHGSTGGRTPQVKEILGKFKEIMGDDRFRRVVIDNPKKVIENKIISADYDDIVMVVKTEKNKKRGLLSRLFGK